MSETQYFIGESGVKTCTWCNGRGLDMDFLIHCHECKGTGFEGGKETERKFDEYIERKLAEFRKNNPEHKNYL